MNHMQTRLDALEHQVRTLHQQTHTVKRRLRWWRGLACGLIGVGLLTWALPSGAAQKAQKKKSLAQRVAALETLLKHFSRDGDEVIITGANLHIVNGLGSTGCINEQGQKISDCPSGLGNLIVGYNESRGDFGPDLRTGSHNVVVGQRHNFSRFGGLVVGNFNEISGDFAVVSGGRFNTASGFAASISGGATNTASGSQASVTGGAGNTASGAFASVSGGASNTASGLVAAVSGGQDNRASGRAAAVSGDVSSVSGGRNRTAAGDFDWVAGSLVENE
jgi:hypothetical protein